MSEKVHSCRFGDVRATSDLPLIADVHSEDRRIRKGPHPDYHNMSGAGAYSAPANAARDRPLSLSLFRAHAA
jgi:hypothetical protein